MRACPHPLPRGAHRWLATPERLCPTPLPCAACFIRPPQWINIGVLVMMTGLGLLTGSSIMSPTTGACWDNATCRAARVRERCMGAASQDWGPDLELPGRPPTDPGARLCPPGIPNYASPTAPRAAPTSRQVSGGVIAPTSVVLMTYALYMYKKRARQILRRETVRYDDQAGPTALTLLLVAVTITAIALAAASLRGAF